MKRFNEWLAVKITKGVGTMYCAYLFFGLDLIELPPVIKQHSVIIWISYITQTVLQLVLLPIIIVGQNLQTTSSNDLHAKVDDLHTKHDAIHKHLGIQK